MPSDTTQVMEAAQKVAELLAQHPAVEKFKQAQRAVTEDAEASRLMADFDRQLQKLMQQQQAGLPVTDAQQDQLEALQMRIASHLKVKALSMAQMEYVDVRRRIGQLLDKTVQTAMGVGQPATAPQGGGPRLVQTPKV